MSQALVARQPICDRKLEIYGYELLHRSANPDAPMVDGDQASAVVTATSVVEIGLDRLVGPRRAFLNMTRNFLVDGHYQALPAERVVLEVLEDIDPDHEVMSAVRRAKDDGYRIALDDFLYDARLEPLIDLADIVKVETNALDLDGLKRHVDLLDRPGILKLAEKVETHDEFEQCRELGYDLFQGFFFCRPNIVHRRKLPSDRLSLIQLMSRLQSSAAVDIGDVSALIERDISLSYRILRAVNSALYSLPRRIESIHQAIVALGIERVKRTVTLLFMTSVDDKPRELMRTSLVRARVCESLAATEGLHSDTLFSVGLLSVLDALLDLSMQEALETVPLSPDVCAALLTRDGPMGRVLQAAIECDRGLYSNLPALGMDPQSVYGIYLDAFEWASEVLAQIA